MRQFPLTVTDQTPSWSPVVRAGDFQGQQDRARLMRIEHREDLGNADPEGGIYEADPAILEHLLDPLWRKLAITI